MLPLRRTTGSLEWRKTFFIIFLYIVQVVYYEHILLFKNIKTVPTSQILMRSKLPYILYKMFRQLMNTDRSAQQTGCKPSMYCIPCAHTCNAPLQTTKREKMPPKIGKGKEILIHKINILNILISLAIKCKLKMFFCL